jgi:hypothetical protein
MVYETYSNLKIRKIFDFWHLNKKFFKIIFDNWKDRHPILIQISYIKEYSEKYKTEGIIKNYNHLHEFVRNT